MSDDDEDICRFGTPLDPIKEGESFDFFNVNMIATNS